MKALLLTILFGVLIGGCGDINGDINIIGKKDKGSTEEEKKPWSSEEFANAQMRCVDLNPNLEIAVATSACVCVLTEASKRWSVEEFTDKDSKQAQAISQSLEDDGILDSCLAKAKVAAASAAPVVPTVPTTTTKEEQDTTAVISNGMAKADIERILGKPDRVDESYLGELQWVYSEYPKGEKVCFARYEYIPNECTITFDEEGKMTGQEDVKAKWIKL